MPEQDAQYEKDRRISGRLQFIGAAAGEAPDVELALITPDGDREPLTQSPTGDFELDARHAGKGFGIELAPVHGGDPRSYRFDDVLRTIGKTGVQIVPEPAWRKWLYVDTCVTGRVRVCRPRISDAIVAAPHAIRRLTGDTIEAATSHHFPTRCRPVCQGKVEVFVRTCCCPIILDPPIIIRHICEIIDCGLVDVEGGIVPVGPGPIERLRGIAQRSAHAQPAADRVFDSVDLPVVDDDEPTAEPATPILPSLAPSVAQAIKRAEATEGGFDPAEITVLARHLSALLTLDPAHRVEYVELYPDLRYLFCRCTTRKVAEVPLQSDGHFDACFRLGTLLRLGCSRRVQYRVSQYQGGQWLVIYDDVARGRSHALGDDAVLDAATIAQSCGDGGSWPAGKPFATLEQIGNTWADTLIHATDQNGETTYAGPLAPTDGLANAAPVGPVTVTAGPYDQPWGQTLSLRYGFHPGLQAVGATYFRTRVVRLDSAGNPNGEFTVTDPISWQKYYPTPPTPEEPLGGVGVTPVLLNDTGPGVDGLCRIPYPDAAWPWLGGQWHVHVNTAELVAAAPRMPNGKYTFVLDLFDASGARLVPDTSAEAAVAGEVGAVGFDFRRLIGPIGPPSSTVVVPHKALASLFHVDNLATYGDIEEILHNGVPSPTNCQFLEGPESDTVALRYSAYHANAFQWYHWVRIKQGLTGPEREIHSNANVVNGDTAPWTFPDLLLGEQKCAFAATLWVYARHTNGIGRLSGYDRFDDAAFALEIA